MKELRNGFTTGSCAAAAAKAACLMLITGKKRASVSVVTPKGLIFDAEILDCSVTGSSASCAVRKDGGDDPDVTTGALVYAEVSYDGKDQAEDGADEQADEQKGRKTACGDPHITIRGGEGVGRVTRPGLDQPVGEYAINSVPRRMITEEILEVCRLYDCSADLTVTISVPGGREIAGKTFNPRLGIEGGISIIGTSGVVEPMSEQAIIDTIKVELQQKRAEGHSTAFISPGNYGLDFMREAYGADLDRSVKCSNYIGDTVDMVVRMGFDAMLLTGHAGKLVKLAGGIMNTHSRMADCRMEIIAAAAVREGADTGFLSSILDCLTTDEAFSLLEERGMLQPVCARIMDRIVSNLEKRAELAAGTNRYGAEREAADPAKAGQAEAGRSAEKPGSSLRIECIMYTKEHGELAATKGARQLIAEL